ncbi:S-adenosyl-L-methionine-dependent methyltransferases superfamily protein [Perilla frutescens var. hirtella]|uniref:S-adenosyl-L-methionine-dependent methyltransferases superfamily protein n=1 Tax=Perilla frutescens var. hirtella TaxID=608512 RepID=A0AAD4JFA2_PERFH|nr:S-adenosyl-L-methionine-dependent methyltransferases superfamily protein [Perilla frutescens var. hirtella]
MATDISEAQLKCAMQRANINYLHTPLSLSNDELVHSIGAEGSVDLITVTEAIHWLDDLPRFYSVATCLLRKPGGIIAVWGFRYNGMKISPEYDEAGKSWFQTTLPYWNSKTKAVFGGYQSLPFPFEGMGMGSEGKPLALDIAKEVSFEGNLRLLQSLSAVAAAKEEGVDLLAENAVEELEAAWGGADVVRSAVCKGFMLVGKVKV